MTGLLHSLWILISVTSYALAIDCNGSFAIAKESDAKDLRENCKIIGGDLEFGGDISENINLDGVEEVRGDWRHNPLSDYHGKVGTLFNISSSTLKLVDGIFDLTGPNGLERLILPNLGNISESVSFDSMANLTHVDFTNLKYFRSLDLETPKLQEFKIDELKGFTRNYTGRIFISDGGSVESLDGLFKGPIAPANETQLPTITIQKIPNIKQLTLGWKSILSAHISGQSWYQHWGPPPNITLILGGPDSETVHIHELETREGIISIERGSKTSNLSIGSFKSMNDMITDLRLPFHQVSDVAIRGDRMTSLELPKEAEQWNNVSISIWLVRKLRFESSVNAEGRQTWYWPNQTMSSFYILGDVSTNFL
uniref:Receptor L-domain domain-containing protein n=1 Tax=Bionectria ochroleuca TaxID=29856 RepID=A0A8H7KFM3_BIOOC